MCECVEEEKEDTPSREGVKDSASFNQPSLGHFVQKEKPNKTWEAGKATSAACPRCPSAHPQEKHPALGELLGPAVERTCGRLGGR